MRKKLTSTSVSRQIWHWPILAFSSDFDTLPLQDSALSIMRTANCLERLGALSRARKGEQALGCSCLV